MSARTSPAALPGLMGKGDAAPNPQHNYVIEVPKRFVRLAADQLPAGVSILVCPPEALAPEFIRVPNAEKEERCKTTGLSCAGLINLLKQAGRKVKTHYIRQPGAVRGVTLIHRQSLVDYISKLPPPPAFAGEGEFQLEVEEG